MQNSFFIICVRNWSVQEDSYFNDFLSFTFTLSLRTYFSMPKLEESGSSGHSPLCYRLVTHSLLTLPLHSILYESALFTNACFPLFTCHKIKPYTLLAQWNMSGSDRCHFLVGYIILLLHSLALSSSVMMILKSPVNVRLSEDWSS